MYRFMFCLLALLIFPVLSATAGPSINTPSEWSAPILIQQDRLQATPRERVRLPRVRPAGQSFANVTLPQEIKCNGSCLCKGASDCVNLVSSTCCGADITCDDSGCACVNQGGCDGDGNLP